MERLAPRQDIARGVTPPGAGRAATRASGPLPQAKTGRAAAQHRGNRPTCADAEHPWAEPGRLVLRSPALPEAWSRRQHALRPILGPHFRMTAHLRDVPESGVSSEVASSSGRSKEASGRRDRRPPSGSRNERAVPRISCGRVSPETRHRSGTFIEQRDLPDRLTAAWSFPARTVAHHGRLYDAARRACTDALPRSLRASPFPRLYGAGACAYNARHDGHFRDPHLHPANYRPGAVIPRGHLCAGTMASGRPRRRIR